MQRDDREDDKVHGVTTLFGCQFDTTGVFGLAGDADERLRRRAAFRGG